MDIISIIRDVEDPRREHMREHSLESIFYVALSAVICGCEGWNEVEAFGKAHVDFFRERIPGFRKCPSHDTFNRVFSILSPESLEESFRRWIAGTCVRFSGVVAIDGKAVRSTCRKSGGSFGCLRMVSAWATANGVVMGQERVGTKTNEITAIPALIQALDLEGCLVTTDAIGCQKKIVASIKEAKADFVIGVKGNQPELEHTIATCFRAWDEMGRPEAEGVGEFVSQERGHGRLETRICHVMSWDVLRLEGWEPVKSIVRVTSYRKDVKTGMESREERLFITSLGCEPERIAKAVRSHWAVENCLHWQLDVSFNEDSTRKRGNAEQNFSLLCKISLMAVKKDKRKGSVKMKRKMAGWDKQVLADILDNVWDEK